MEKTIEAVQQTQHIDLYANGISSSVALDAFNRFLTIGLSVSWLPDIAHQFASASRLTAQDVALAFSYAGETRATVKAMSLAHQQGAMTIAVTSNPHSSLSRYQTSRNTTQANDLPPEFTYFSTDRYAWLGWHYYLGTLQFVR